MDIIYGFSGEVLNVFVPYGRGAYWFEAWTDKSGRPGRSVGRVEDAHGASAEAYVDDVDALAFMESIDKFIHARSEMKFHYKHEAVANAERLFAELIREARIEPPVTLYA